MPGSEKRIKMDFYMTHFMPFRYGDNDVIDVIKIIKVYNKVAMNNRAEEFTFALLPEFGDIINVESYNLGICRTSDIHIDIHFDQKLYDLLQIKIDDYLNGRISDILVYINGMPVILTKINTYYVIDSLDNLRPAMPFDKLRPAMPFSTKYSSMLLENIAMINNKDLEITNVIFRNPATIVFWNDNTKTIVKCQNGDTYDKEKGLAMCIAKKYLGNEKRYYKTLRTWLEPKKKKDKPKKEEPIKKKTTKRKPRKSKSTKSTS